MPINKNSLRRYRIEDRLLSDPNYDYTTAKILERVNKEMSDEDKVGIRMIQKDIIALEEVFGKEMEHGHGGRGTVRYKDQSSPLFYQELTSDEEDLLREVLKTLGQFNGLDNFTWLDLLKKKLDMDDTSARSQPIISFSKNDDLEIDASLLGRLFTAISRRKVLKLKYRKFNSEPQDYFVYPYQLKQYNDRWYLLCTPLPSKKFPVVPDDFVINMALDRIVSFSYVEDRGPYIDTPVDLKAMYDEIIGVTLDSRFPEAEDIYFAVEPSSVEYIRTKKIHSTQMPIEGESAEAIFNAYPSLRGWYIFSICCRMNYELMSAFLSFGENLVVFDEPSSLGVNGESGEESLVPASIATKIMAMAENYRKLTEEKAKLQQKI